MIVFLSIVGILAVSAFFSGTEIAYVSADRLRVALQKQQGSRRANIISKFFDDPSNFLGTMLVGNNIALVIFGNMMEKALLPFLMNISSGWLSGEFGTLFSITIISTVVVLLFGEFLPKVIFRLFANHVLRFFSYLLLILRYGLSPLVILMVKTSEFLLEKILGVSLESEENIFNRLDLKHFIEQTSSTGLDTEMLEKAMELTETKVNDCLIERKYIAAINVKSSIENLKKTFIKSGFSKIIVYEKNLDNIIGYVHHQHLLKRPTSIRSILFDIPKIEPNMPVMNLMNEFMAAKTSIAYVQKNEKTVGIITLEDILEEVFGEIEDEHDAVKSGGL